MGWWMSGGSFDALTSEYEELERFRGELRVLLLPDDRIVKIFRRRRLLSGSTLYPYSFRFARNSQRLMSLGFRSVDVERVFFCPSRVGHGVIYPLLEGHAVHELEPSAALRSRLATFIAQLHERGVLFRSLNINNVLQQTDGTFALIDVGDVRFQRGPLAPRLRTRNFRHLLRLVRHREWFRELGYREFVDSYLDAAGYTGDRRENFFRTLLEMPTELDRAG
jgi:serine/threonine protein kinase